MPQHHVGGFGVAPSPPASAGGFVFGAPLLTSAPAPAGGFGGVGFGASPAAPHSAFAGFGFGFGGSVNQPPLTGFGQHLRSSSTPSALFSSAAPLSRSLPGPVGAETQNGQGSNSQMPGGTLLAFRPAPSFSASSSQDDDGCVVCLNAPVEAGFLHGSRCGLQSRNEPKQATAISWH